MNEYYLKALSVDVLLANAGFNAKHWDNYILPRSRGSSLVDADVRHCVEFFFPNIYESYLRAEASYENRPWTPDDVVSETNYRFLWMVLNVTHFWLQDFVVLFQRYPDIKNHPPWSTLLSHEINGIHLLSIIDRVGAHVASDGVDYQSKLLHQTELLRAVHNSHTAGASMHDIRLSQLPVQVASLVEEKREADKESMLRAVTDASDLGTRRAFLRAGGVGDADMRMPRTAECLSPQSQTSAISQHMGSQGFAGSPGLSGSPGLTRSPGPTGPSAGRSPVAHADAEPVVEDDIATNANDQRAQQQDQPEHVRVARLAPNLVGRHPQQQQGKSRGQPPPPGDIRYRYAARYRYRISISDIDIDIRYRYQISISDIDIRYRCS